MQTENSPPVQAATEPNYIVKLFRGDVPLPITYWIFGVAIVILLRIPKGIIESNYLDIISLPLGTQLFKAYYWLVFGYGLFIFIAIWRSAGKFEGKKLWAVLARIIVIFNVIVISNNLINGFRDQVDIKSRISKEAQLINRSLPRMVDSKTRLDRVSVFDNSIHYNYTLVDLDALDVNTDRIEIAMTPVIKLSTCENKEMRVILDADMDIVFAYYDKTSNPLVKIIVSRSDCI